MMRKNAKVFWLKTAGLLTIFAVVGCTTAYQRWTWRGTPHKMYAGPALPEEEICVVMVPPWVLVNSVDGTVTDVAVQKMALLPGPHTISLLYRQEWMDSSPRGHFTDGIYSVGDFVVRLEAKAGRTYGIDYEINSLRRWEAWVEDITSNPYSGWLDGHRPTEEKGASKNQRVLINP